MTEFMDTRLSVKQFHRELERQQILAHMPTRKTNVFANQNFKTLLLR